MDVSVNALEVKARIGVVPERSNLYNELSARQNLVFMAKLYGLPRAEWYIRADALLDRFALSDRADSPFTALSGGMKRRLTIAAALVHRPLILFLDEPTSGLDVQSARSLRAMIRVLGDSGVTIFLTTHLIAEAQRLCDRVAIIVKGALVAVDTPLALRERCQDEKRLELTISSPSKALQAALQRSPEVIRLSQAGDTLRMSVRSVDRALRDVMGITQRYGVTIEALHTVNPSLEDAFVQLTGIDVETLRANKSPGKMGGRG